MAYLPPFAGHRATRGAHVACRTQALDGARSRWRCLTEPALRHLEAEQRSTGASERSQSSNLAKRAGQNSDERLVGAAFRLSRTPTVRRSLLRTQGRSRQSSESITKRSPKPCSK